MITSVSVLAIVFFSSLLLIVFAILIGISKVVLDSY